jgi:hypothetical protein
MRIREEYGLAGKTKVVVVDDVLGVDRELFSSIEAAMKNPLFLDLHLQRNIPEANSAQYNYIMLLKAWCLKEAAGMNEAAGETLAWLDFGFNYGGRFYRKSEEFDFLWEWDFDKKIHLLQKNEFDALPPYEIIKRNNTYIQGTIIISKTLTDVFWRMGRENMLALNKTGLADDDQLLWYMGYLQAPELHELHKADRWIDIFNLFTDRKFTYEEPQQNKMKHFVYSVLHPTEFAAVRKMLFLMREARNLAKYKFRG